MYARTDRLKEFAEHLAARAAHLIWTDRLRAAGGPLRGAQHTQAGVISPAGLGAERLMRELVAFHRPDDAVLGTEPTTRGQITWVVDAVNGSTNYLRGLPSYGVSVAAVLDGVVLAGAVAEPHSRRVWSAGLGQGASLHDPAISADWLEIRVGSTQRLDSAVVSTRFAAADAVRGEQAAVIAALLPHIGDLRCSGSPSLDLVHVAAGWIDASVDHEARLRDCAAGLLIAEEAGATVHWPGSRGPARQLGHPVFAAAPHIADALLDALERADAASVRRTAERTQPSAVLPYHTA